MAQTRVVTPLNDPLPGRFSPFRRANSDDETFLYEPEVTTSQARVPTRCST